jgi:hypothetical protein
MIGKKTVATVFEIVEKKQEARPEQAENRKRDQGSRQA